MSGGSFDYKCFEIEDTYCGKMEDDYLNDMMDDLVELLNDLEWYNSGDIDEIAYIETKKVFKDKWFGMRDNHLRDIVSEKLLNAIEDIKKS